MELEIELKEQGKISRLTNKTFKFDPKLGEGFYAANYFLKSRKIVEENDDWSLNKETYVDVDLDDFDNIETNLGAAILPGLKLFKNELKTNSK